jgi:hypothetical protein
MIGLHRSGQMVLGVAGIVLVFGLALQSDANGHLRRLRATPGPTWLQTFERLPIRPDDLIVTEGPEVVRFYFGRAEFNIRNGGNERYTYLAPDGAVRSIYTDSILLNDPGEFAELVEQPNPGRTVWVIGRDDRMQRLSELIEPGLWQSLVRSADRNVKTRDGWRMMQITLPRRDGTA